MHDDVGKDAIRRSLTIAHCDTLKHFVNISIPVVFTIHVPSSESPLKFDREAVSHCSFVDDWKVQRRAFTTDPIDGGGHNLRDLSAT